MLAPAIIPVAACCLVQKVAYFMKDMRIEREHKLILKSWDPELSHECSDICAIQVQRLLCTYSTGHSQLDRLARVFSDLHLCTRYLARNACEQWASEESTRAWRGPLNVAHVGGLRARGTYTVHVNAYNNCSRVSAHACTRVHAHLP